MNSSKPQDHLFGDFFLNFPEVISGAEDGEPEEKPEPKEPEVKEPKEPEEKEPEEKEDVTGLKSALSKERTRATNAERELKKLQKEKEARELAEQSEADQAKTKAEKAEAKATKLAAGLLKRDIDSAIRKEAEKLKFLDVDDVLEVLDRSSITAEQDDDDPSDITIDLKTVEAAVKALANKKPHWINQGTEDGEPTGGKFGGKQQKQKTSEETYRENYSAL